MEEVSFSLLKLDENLINLLEKIRFDAYSINNFSASQSFYSHCLNNGNYIVYGAFYRGTFVGACYVTKSYNSLFIERLFILKKFQNTELHLGSRLLKYVLSNQKYIEEYFNMHFKYSFLDNATKDNSLYEKLGYRKTENLLMKKRLD